MPIRYSELKQEPTPADLAAKENGSPFVRARSKPDGTGDAQRQETTARDAERTDGRRAPTPSKPATAPAPESSDADSPTGFQRFLPLIGLSFWQAWWMCSTTTGLLSGPVQWGVGTMRLLLWVTLACYALITWLSTKYAPFSSPRLFMASGAGGVAGTLLVSVATHVGTLGVLGIGMEAVGVLVFGVSNALLLLMWGERWSTLAAGNVGRHLCTSFAAAFVLYFILTALPTGAAIAANAVFPALSAWALSVSQSEPCRSDPISPTKLQLKPIAVLLACIFVFSVSFGSGELVFSINDMSGRFQPMSMIVAGIMIALMAMLMLALRSVGDPYAFARPVMPAVVAGFLVSLITAPSQGFLGNGIIIFGIYCLDMFMMFSASDLAYRTGKPVAALLGIALIVSRLGTTLGTLLGTWLAVTFAVGSASLQNSALLLAIAVLLAGSLGFSESRIRSIYRISPASRVPDLDERCAEIGASARLSARELDVMRQLARGKSIAAVSEALGIAQGTVKHHASNTYRKLGVYDRQGLIDLVAGEADPKQQ